MLKKEALIVGEDSRINERIANPFKKGGWQVIICTQPSGSLAYQDIITNIFLGDKMIFCVVFDVHFQRRPDETKFNWEGVTLYDQLQQTHDRYWSHSFFVSIDIGTPSPRAIKLQKMLDDRGIPLENRFANSPNHHYKMVDRAEYLWSQNKPASP